MGRSTDEPKVYRWKYEGYGAQELHACNVLLSKAEVGALLVLVVCFNSKGLYQWLWMEMLR